jgi:hypothetical protein
MATAIVVAAVSDIRKGYSRLRDLVPGLYVPVIGLAVMITALLALRGYQQAHARGLFDRYLSAARQSVTLSEEPVDGRTLLRPIGPISDVAGRAPGHGGISRIGRYYFVATADAARCVRSRFSGTVTYEGTLAEELSRTFEISLGADHKTSMFFPAFGCIGLCTDGHFAGLSIPSEQRSCLESLEVVTGYKALPLALWLTLTPDWRQKRLFQTIDP